MYHSFIASNPLINNEIKRIFINRLCGKEGGRQKERKAGRKTINGKEEER